MDVNTNYEKHDSLGASFDEFLHRSRSEKKELKFTITFTKGKLEVEAETIQRININNESAIIHYKDGTRGFINLQNVTNILEE